jgi:hypothetical protein
MSNEREDGYRLYEHSTYLATERLVGLRDGSVDLAEQDVIDLFRTFAEGSQDVGTVPRLQEFGQWLAACGWFHDSLPAEVVW